MSKFETLIVIIFLLVIGIPIFMITPFNTADYISEFNAKTITISNPSLQNPITQTFKTVHNGQIYYITMDFDPNLYDPIAKEQFPSKLHPQYGFNPINEYNHLNHPSNTYVKPLVKAIKSIDPDPQTQAKLAIYLVRNIPYDHDKSSSITPDSNIPARYPYITLYDNIGICSDQTYLLGYLLQELGFSIYFLGYSQPKSSHINIGISTTPHYSYKDTPYLIIEPTANNSIFLSTNSYESPNSYPDPPFTLKMSEGLKLTDLSHEYRDAPRLTKIRSEKDSLISAIITAPEYAYYVYKYGLNNPVHPSS